MVLKQDKDSRHLFSADVWNLHVDPSGWVDIQQGLHREWLVTNGLGGYASGSIVGATTRSYHGLLVAALKPPVERVVLVTKIDEEVTLPGGQLIQLGVNEYVDGTVSPRGHTHLEAISLNADIPRFLYRLNEQLTLEKRIWMKYGQNTTCVQYALYGPMDKDASVELALYPFCLSRGYHNVTQGSDNWHFLVEHYGNRCRVRAYDEAPTLHIIAGPQASFSPTGFWYWNVFHRHDAERGLSAREDVYQPGIFRIRLEPGMRTTLVLSAERQAFTDFGNAHHEDTVAHIFTRHQRRTRHLLAVAHPHTNNLQDYDPILARLLLAADQFIVARPDSRARQPVRLSPDRKTIIAGYPWFTDWGRDAMISLPGLLLATGRYSEARGLLKAFTSYVHEGIIPNHFPDRGETPEYNTIDATLWMFYALHHYFSVTADWSLLKEIFSTLSEIFLWYIHGTSYGIGVDPSDGLLRGGAPGVQLTWMDARIGDRVVTPRWGKPVEVNALWYHVLTVMEAWAVRLSMDATQYSQLRTLVRENFAERFWYAEGGYLYDVIDVYGEHGRNDASLRPNQLFAASLSHDLLSDEQVISMLQRVTTHLLTPMGLRTLSPLDPAYHDHFQGDPTWRDSAYHQGTVWPWLIGPYIDVHLHVYNDRDAILSLLRPLLEQFWQGCLGTISEVAEPEPPFTPAGCFAQAWSVAEVLRCWRQVNRESS